LTLATSRFILQYWLLGVWLRSATDVTVNLSQLISTGLRQLISHATDETYIKIKGQWKYLYRAVDKDGNTVDFLLRARRDRLAAQRYFERSIILNGVPHTVTVDRSGANLAALKAINVERETSIRIRQKKYLNNIVEQDHRAIKRRIRPMLGFKKFGCARILLTAIELMHMICKGQMKNLRLGRTAAQLFYSLAA